MFAILPGGPQKRARLITDHFTASNTGSVVTVAPDDAMYIPRQKSGGECPELIHKDLAAAHGRCELCGKGDLRYQFVEEIGAAGRATMQRVNASRGYLIDNVNLYCLVCNLFINDLDVDGAEALIEYIFGANDSGHSNKDLSAAEERAIKNVAYNKNMTPKSLLQIAQDAGHRCALSGVVGTFQQVDWVDADHKTRMFHLPFNRIVPGARGGAYTQGNIWVLSWPLNLARSDMVNGDFLVWFGRMKAKGAMELKANLARGVKRLSNWRVPPRSVVIFLLQIIPLLHVILSIFDSIPPYASYAPYALLCPQCPQCPLFFFGSAKHPLRLHFLPKLVQRKI
ncbi:hypothetical protein BC940DRAFT_351382 [Gongronella butleri]|nr:hypothetical protein BC940DRAFT_351382 [Gongronella butleri]